MARITVEDCLNHVDNRFDLVLLAAKRARQLARGVEPVLPSANDKPTVIALREIAAGKINRNFLQAVQQKLEQPEALDQVSIIKNIERFVRRDQPYDE